MWMIKVRKHVRKRQFASDSIFSLIVVAGRDCWVWIGLSAVGVQLRRLVPIGCNLFVMSK
jgi:hypothetical protein